MARTARKAYASIKAWREATNTKQDALAKRVGISATHLANVEVGSRTCSLDVAKKLARITNVPIELIGETAQSSAGN